MLQTAPMLMLHPPTTGPNAKPDSQPLRLDFGNAYASPRNTKYNLMDL